MANGQKRKPMAKILLVDDNRDLLAMQAHCLRGAEHTVVTTDSGIEALRLVRANPFDVLITDVVMPDADGIAIVMEIRKDFPDLKIIAISGGGKMDADGYLEIARGLGANKTCAKPFSGQELINAVAEVLRQP